MGKFRKKEKEMRQEVTFKGLPDIPGLKQPNIYNKSPK